jgi:hypothetical protein
MSYADINDYIKYLHENSERVGTLQLGAFYTYNYDFYKDKRPYEEVKFYDRIPLIFLFDFKKAKNGSNLFIGLNFHHLPVKARQIWLSRIRSYYTQLMESNKRLNTIDYKQLFYVHKKAILGVRQYRLEAVSRNRRIATTDLDEILKYYSKTYYGVTYDQVANKYRTTKARTSL